MPLKKIISFGHKYGIPEHGAGVVVVDIRKMFRNPHYVPRLQQVTGTHEDVQQEILSTPNFEHKYEYLKTVVTAPGLEVAYIGCIGGRHRSVFIAEKLAHDLGVEVEHRDIHR